MASNGATAGRLAGVRTQLWPASSTAEAHVAVRTVTRESTSHRRHTVYDLRVSRPNALLRFQQGRQAPVPRSPRVYLSHAWAARPAIRRPVPPPPPLARPDRLATSARLSIPHMRCAATQPQTQQMVPQTQQMVPRPSSLTSCNCRQSTMIVPRRSTRRRRAAPVSPPRIGAGRVVRGIRDTPKRLGRAEG